MLLPLAHAAVLAITWYTLWIGVQMPDLAPRTPSGEVLDLPLNGYVVYLTVWGMITQIVYYATALLNDAFGTNEKLPKKAPLIRSLKDHIFPLAFATGLYLVLLFWGAYFYNKDLVYPEDRTKNVPAWVNQVSHTSIGVFIITELLFTNITYPSKNVTATLSILFISSYMVWLRIILVYYNHHVYPMLEIFSTSQTVAFHTFNSSLFVMSAMFGHKLSVLVSKGNGELEKKRI